MTDPALKDTTNPFNMRRLRWQDHEGRNCSNVVSILDVEQGVARLREEGVKKVEVDRLAWTKVYDVIS